MKKIMNAPEQFVDEMLEGIVLAHPDYLRLARENKRVLLNNRPIREGKVGIVTAGGSGHLPAFLGGILARICLKWLQRRHRKGPKLREICVPFMAALPITAARVLICWAEDLL